MDKNAILLAGSWPEKAAANPVFDPIVVDFLTTLSQKLRTDQNLQTDSQSQSLAFWLRRNHLESFLSIVSHHQYRLGRGTIFHVAPVNVPMLFAYSFAISLLAGNNNIVRISPQIVQTVQPLLQIINKLMDNAKFSSIKSNNAFISYAKDTTITNRLSATCDGRIIWGGDQSINDIRQSPLPPQAIELCFPDRYSIAVFDAHTLANYSDTEINLQAQHFYNDTYEMDQNACSSPHIIFWLTHCNNDIHEQQIRWWNAVATIAKKYDLAPLKASRKYTDLCTFAMTIPEITNITRFTNRLYVYTLSAVPTNITHLTGAFGQFFQINLPSNEMLYPHLTKKIQTISLLGVDKKEFRRNLISYNAMGGDRIVMVGQAMDMHIVWDGYNMIEFLSRIIS